MQLPVFTVATAPADPPDDSMIVVEDGDDGARCIAVSFSGQWHRIEPTLGAPISATPRTDPETEPEDESEECAP